MHLSGTENLNLKIEFEFELEGKKRKLESEKKKKKMKGNLVYWAKTFNSGPFAALVSHPRGLALPWRYTYKLVSLLSRCDHGPCTTLTDMWVGPSGSFFPVFS